jgi:hypothetical protein
MASAMRFRPSGLSLRFRGDLVAGVTEATAFAAAFLLPLGRPGPERGEVVPASSARACCNFDI